MCRSNGDGPTTSPCLSRAASPVDSSGGEFRIRTTFFANTGWDWISIDAGIRRQHLASPSTLNLILSEAPNASPEQILATASLTADFAPPGERLRAARLRTLELDPPILVRQGQQYYLRFEVDSGMLDGAVPPSNETDYDYGLPFRVDGYDAFGGIYRGDLNPAGLLG
jgi:hypothetical protein